MESNIRMGDYPMERGITRQDFTEYCAIVAKTLGYDPSLGPKMVERFLSSERPTVLWLHFSECNGCSEAALRTTSPWLDELLFDNVSLDYHVMTAAGSRVEEILLHAVSHYEGRFFCVVEGAIPSGEKGDHHGPTLARDLASVARTVCPKAFAVIALGTCASYGGLPAADSNPRGGRGVNETLGSRSSTPLINLPGCPPDPLHFVGTLANCLLFGGLPERDDHLRPRFAYDQPHASGPKRQETSSTLYLFDPPSERANPWGPCRERLQKSSLR